MLRHGHTSLDLKPTPICFFLILPPLLISSFFFFNDTATTEIYTLSLHDALPISILAFHSAAGWLPYFSPADSQVDLSDRLVRLSTAPTPAIHAIFLTTLGQTPRSGRRSEARTDHSGWAQANVCSVDEDRG